MKILLLSSRRSTYGAQILEAASELGIEIQAVIIENEPSRGGWRRVRRYIRKYGVASVVLRGIEVFIACVARARLRRKAQENAERAALRHGIPCHKVDSLNEPEAWSIIEQFKPDLALLGGTRILSTDCLRRFPSGVLNAHVGLLPRYRGNYGNRWALLNGDQTGISVYLVDAGLDTGPILATRNVDMIPHEHLVEFEERSTRLGAALLAETAQAYLAGTLPPRSQSRGDGTQHPFMSARYLLRLYRKLYRDRRAARKRPSCAETKVG